MYNLIRARARKQIAILVLDINIWVIYSSQAETLRTITELLNSLKKWVLRWLNILKMNKNHKKNKILSVKNMVWKMLMFKKKGYKKRERKKGYKLVDGV